MPVAVPSALAEPTRLDAMRLLADGSEHGVCEVMRTLGASQGLTLRHRQVLKRAGRVVERRNAQWVCSRLRPDLPEHLKTLVTAALVEEAMM